MDKSAIIMIYGVLTLGVSFLIGIYFTRIQKSLSSYYVASKGLGIFVIGMGIAATSVSGWTFIGGPGMTYAFGMSYVFVGGVALLLPSGLIAWWLQARKFRMMADTHGALSVPDIAFYRYDSRAVSALCALSVFVGCIAYMSAQVASIGYIMSVMFNMSFFWGTFFGLLVVGGYTILGGIHAALYADVFQGAIMLFTSVFIAVAAVVLAGGVGALYEGPKAINPQLTHPQGVWTTPFIIAYIISTNVGNINWPQLTSRFLMIRNLTQFKWTPMVQNAAVFSFSALIYTVGLSYLALQSQGNPGAPALARGDQAMPTFLMNFFPGGVAGIVLAGTLAAILSTASGFINIGSAAIVRDVLQQSLGLRLRNEVLWARLAGIVVVVLAWWLAATAPEFVVLLGVAASGIWASTLVPVISFGLNWRGASREGALVALIVGIAGASILQMGNVYGWWRLPAGMQAGGIMAPISFVLFIVVSLLTKGRDKMPPSMEIIMRMPLWSRPPLRVPVRLAAGGADETTVKEG